MNFFGKIIVVIQLVLSIMFLAFAGVVYTARIKWKDEAKKQSDTVVRLQKQLTDQEAETTRQKNDLTQKVTAANALAGEEQAKNRGLQQRVAQLTEENNQIQVTRKSAVEQSTHHSLESKARVEEATNVRQINTNLAAKLDEGLGKRIQLEDQLRSTQLALEQAELKNRDLIAKNALYQQTLAKAGIEADAKELASRNVPPPAVKGRVTEVKPSKRAGGPEYVTVALGSDDGLKKGDEMTVYHSGLQNGAKAKYLGRIKLLSVEPDQSVGEVVEGSRNGVIKVGDDATTKL